MRTYAKLKTAASLIQKKWSELGQIKTIKPLRGKFVSSTGFVYSVWKFTGQTSWKVYRLKTMRHSGGYPQVNVGGKPVRLHNLVAQCFLHKPTTTKKLVVRHRDDNPLNNDASNLRYGTQRANSADAKRNGRKLGRPPTIPEEVVRKIRKDAEWFSLAKNAKRNNCAVSTVHAILRGRKRKDVL